MVSITLSVPPEVKKKMDAFPEINWSGFIRAAIEDKVERLAWREDMVKKLKEEEPFDEWAVGLGRKVKKDAYDKTFGKNTTPKGKTSK
jgi:predicted transcriptional regulator